MPLPGFKQQVWVKSGEGNKYVSQKVFSQHSKCQLKGYSSKTNYKTLAKALAACAASSSCNGVTKEGSKKFRLNTGTSPKTVKTMKCYIKAASYDSTAGWFLYLLKI